VFIFIYVGEKSLFQFKETLEKSAMLFIVSLCCRCNAVNKCLEDRSGANLWR